MEYGRSAIIIPVSGLSAKRHLLRKLKSHKIIEARDTCGKTTLEARFLCHGCLPAYRTATFLTFPGTSGAKPWIFGRTTSKRTRYVERLWQNEVEFQTFLDGFVQYLPLNWLRP